MKEMNGKAKGKEAGQGKRYPKGHFIGLGMAVFSGMGVPLWLVTDNPGMIGVGVAVGVAIGAAWEQKYNKNPRELTPEEARTRKIGLWAGVLVLIAGALAGIAALMMFL